jgi:hypothetical protein
VDEQRTHRYDVLLKCAFVHSSSPPVPSLRLRVSTNYPDDQPQVLPLTTTTPPKLESTGDSLRLSHNRSSSHLLGPFDIDRLSTRCQSTAITSTCVQWIDRSNSMSSLFTIVRSLLFSRSSDGLPFFERLSTYFVSYAFHLRCKHTVTDILQIWASLIRIVR